MFSNFSPLRWSSRRKLEQEKVHDQGRRLFNVDEFSRVPPGQDEAEEKHFKLEMPKKYKRFTYMGWIDLIRGKLSLSLYSSFETWFGDFQTFH